MDVPLALVMALLVGCGSAPRSFEGAGRDHASLDVLLARYVSPDGRVDYERWHATPADVAALDAHLAEATRATPKTSPERFSGRSDRMAYWINLYNALVIREVLRRWPLSSVRDVKVSAMSRVFKGKGFFRDLRFSVGGTSMSLDDIEHEVLRQRFKDARIHFAINCASESCPVIRPGSYAGPELDAQLDRSTREFIADPTNVTVDDARKRVVLSKIFDWYEDDFVAHAGTLEGARPTVLGFIHHFADSDKRAALERARAHDYDIDYRDYDWGVNRSHGTAAQTAAAGSVDLSSRSPAPADAAFEMRDGSTWRLADARGKVVVIDFWATYCAPCRELLPKLAALDRTFGDDVVVVAVSVDESDAAVDAFLADIGVELPVARDRSEASFGAPWSVGSLPTEVVIDRDGQIRLRLEGMGPGEFATLEGAVATLVGRE